VIWLGLLVRHVGRGDLWFGVVLQHDLRLLVLGLGHLYAKETQSVTPELTGHLVGPQRQPGVSTHQAAGDVRIRENDLTHRLDAGEISVAAYRTSDCREGSRG
jgi:hypothetical protein